MVGHIFIEREIGIDTTPKTVRDNIAAYPQATSFEVHFNSIGGDVYDGYQIGNMLKNLGKPTIGIIEGQCASIATYDACCCDKIIMSPHGDFMIHDPTGTIQGRADDFLRAATQLNRIKNEIIDRYMTKVSRKGVTREQLSSMMDSETSMSATQAFDFGFVDEVREKLKAVAKININKFDMENVLTKEEAKGFFDKMFEKIDAHLKRFKNVVQLALADGTMASSDAPDESTIVGSSVTGADGNPLPDGPYETVDGNAFVVAGGKITEYGPTAADKGGDEKAAMQKQIDDLTAQLAAKSTDAAAAAQATAKVEADFKNQLSTIRKEFEDMKKKTFGDDSAPTRDPKIKDKADDLTDEERNAIDPMAQMGEAWITSRTQNFGKKK